MLDTTGVLLDALEMKPEDESSLPRLRRLHLVSGAWHIKQIENIALDLQRLELELTYLTKTETWTVEEWQSLRSALLRHAGSLEVLKLPILLGRTGHEAKIGLDFPPLPQLKVLQLSFSRKYDNNTGSSPPLSFPYLQTKLNYSHLFPNLEELVISTGGWITWLKEEEIGDGGQWTYDILRTFFPVPTAGHSGGQDPDQGPGQRSLRHVKVQTCGFLGKWRKRKSENKSQIKVKEGRRRTLVESIKQNFPNLHEENIILDGKPYKTI